jgi:rfaE bifunctional protein kinase chain/domain
LIRLDFENQPAGELLLRMFGAFERALPRQDAVLFSDYGKGGLTHLPQMISQARAAGKVVLVDPKGSDYDRYAGASVITPNLAELAQVIGTWPDEPTLVERAQALRKRLRLDALVLTRAEEGMSLFDSNGHLHVPTVAREVFDVTGAGDTVIATLACMLATGMSLRDAIPIANRAGGIVVGKFGTAGLTYDELFA